MSIVETQRPMIIDPNDRIKCRLLCDLKCVYSKGNISYVFDNDGKLHFEFKGKDSVDVYFNNIAYKLKEIYIGKRRHVSYPEDPTIVGECTLFHTGNNDNLVISIFLRSTRGFSDSQDFFSQFLSKKVGTQNYDKTIDITTDDAWSPQQMLPSESAFYKYSDTNENTNIVFINPVEIDADNFNKALELQKPILEERKKSKDDHLYYHPVDSTVPRETSSEECKPTTVFEESDPHKNCDESTKYIDSPEEWDGIPGHENVVQCTIVSIFLLMLAIGFFKGLPRLPFQTGKLIIKFLGTLIWLPIHLCYIWFGQGSTIFIFFWIFIFGYLKEKYQSAKAAVSDKMNQQDGQDPNIQDPNIQDPLPSTDSSTDMNTPNIPDANVTTIQTYQPEDDPQPSPSPDDPQPSPSPDDPQPSPSPDDPQPSPSPDDPQPSPSPDDPQPSPSPDDPPDVSPDVPPDVPQPPPDDPSDKEMSEEDLLKKQKREKICAHLKVWDSAYLKKKHGKKAYYRLFDLPDNATVKQAKARFREWALVLHPDKCNPYLGKSKCEECFRILRTGLPKLIKYINWQNPTPPPDNPTPSPGPTPDDPTPSPDDPQPSPSPDDPQPSPSPDDPQPLPLIPQPSPDDPQPLPDDPQPSPDVPQPPPLPPRPQPSPDVPQPPPLPPRPTPDDNNIFRKDEIVETDDKNRDDDDLDKMIQDEEDKFKDAWDKLDADSLPPPPPPPPPSQFNRMSASNKPISYDVNWNDKDATIQQEGGVDMNSMRQKVGMSPSTPSDVKKYYGNSTEYKDHMNNLKTIPDVNDRNTAINGVNDYYNDIIREIKEFVKSNHHESFTAWVKVSEHFKGNYGEVVRDISEGKIHRLDVHERVFDTIKAEINKIADNERKDRERARLCEWLSTEMPIKNDDDAHEAFDLITGNLNRNLPDKVKEYEEMSTLYRRFAAEGHICKQGSEAWALFMSRISDGIYTQKHPGFRFTCTAISIIMLGFIFISLFGSPIKFKSSKNKATTNNAYEDGDKICRNRIRTLGNGYAIDSCYRPTDLSKYILDKTYRKKFYESYIDLRKRGRNAYDACTVSFKRLDSQIDMNYNYKMDILNDSDAVTDTVEIKSCSFYNDFFAEGVKRACRTKRIRSKPQKDEKKSWFGGSTKTKDGESKGWWATRSEERQVKQREREERMKLCEWLTQFMPVEIEGDAEAAYALAKSNLDRGDERAVFQFERMTRIYNKYKNSPEGIICKKGWFSSWWGGDEKPAAAAAAPAPAPKTKKQKKREKKKKAKRKEKKKEKKSRKKIKKAFGGKCFASDTRILMNNGKFKYIQDVNIGDILWNNNTVEGKMNFSGKDTKLVNNSGIISTFSHHVLHNGQFMKSGHVPGSKVIRETVDILYDIDTENHRIVILNDNNRGVTYTDFTEVDDETGKVYEYELDLLNYTHNQQQCNV